MNYLEYYGFSLLCYIQRECNSKFEKNSDSLDFSGVVDFSKDSSKKFDIVETIFKDGMPSEGVEAIGDAALAVSPQMVDIVWRVSQFTPDRKRSALAMVRGKTPAITKTKSKSTVREIDLDSKKLMAVSISPYNIISLSGLSSGGSKDSKVRFLIEVGSNDCERLCLKFMELVRERRIPTKT